MTLSTLDSFALLCPHCRYVISELYAAPDVSSDDDAFMVASLLFEPMKTVQGKKPCPDCGITIGRVDWGTITCRLELATG